VIQHWKKKVPLSATGRAVGH